MERYLTMIKQTDLSKLLAMALDSDKKSHGKLTALIVRNDSCIWQSINLLPALDTTLS